MLGDLKHNETQIGTLYVIIDGKEIPLIVFQGHNDDSGWTEVDPETGKVTYLDNRQKTDGIGFVAFRDGTSGKTTYGGGRNIPVDVAHPESVKYADFNRATNPPCSFTVFCTCPFAPNQNVLPFAVEAGERIPEIVDFGD